MRFWLQASGFGVPAPSRWTSAGVLAAFVALTVAGVDAQGGVAARLAGSWRLVSYYNFAADGSKRPAAYDAGRIVYDSAGQMAAHLMDTPERTAPAAAATDARSAAPGRYLAYYGAFVVDEQRGTVVHKVEGASLPNWIGTDQVRHFELSEDGNRLSLSVKNSEGRTTGTLTWERIR